MGNDSEGGTAPTSATTAVALALGGLGLLSVSYNFFRDADQSRQAAESAAAILESQERLEKIEGGLTILLDVDEEGIFGPAAAWIGRTEELGKMASFQQLDGLLDGDGIVPPIDQCPDLPGPPTDGFYGCPAETAVDADGDDVADIRDHCPETIEDERDLVINQGEDFGWKAEIFVGGPDDGCTDSDGDGVADRSDACPETPKGEAAGGQAANARGCHPSQVAETCEPLPLAGQQEGDTAGWAVYAGCKGANDPSVPLKFSYAVSADGDVSFSLIGPQEDDEPAGEKTPAPG